MVQWLELSGSGSTVAFAGGVSGGECEWLSVPVIDCRPCPASIQPNASWDWLQSPHDPEGYI